MEPPIDPQLEKVIDQELKKLPLQAAPLGLATGVMAAIQARAARPWWQQSWAHWPLGPQVAFVAVTLGLAGGVAGGDWMLRGHTQNLWQMILQRGSDSAGAMQDWLPDLSWTNGVAGWLDSTWMTYGGIGLGLIYLCSVAAATLCVRLVLKRA
jgi:hypothetical protein